MWEQAVRGGKRCVHGLKRRGVCTVADLWDARGEGGGGGSGGKGGKVEGLFERDDEKLADKCWDMLGLLADVLHDALGEDDVKEGGEGTAGDGESTWRRLPSSRGGSKVKRDNRVRHDLVERPQRERVALGKSWVGMEQGGGGGGWRGGRFRPVTR